MTRIGRQLDRRAHLVAEQVDRVEVLGKPDEVAVVAQVARAPAALAVVHVGRSGDEAEADVPAAEDDLPGGVARREDEGRGSGRERLRDETAIEPHDAAGAIDVGPGRGAELERARRHELDAELLENA